MQLLNEVESGIEAGRVLEDTTLYDVARLLDGEKASAPITTSDLLRRHGKAGIDALREGLASESRRALARAGTFDGERLLPAVTGPDKIIGVGLNFANHVAETKREMSEHPVIFAKFRNSLAAHGQTIKLPSISTDIDYEGELGVVIGETSSDVSPDEALAKVAAVTVVNDLTSRDLQYRTHQWLAGKALDGFLPCGPTLVTLDELPPIPELHLTTRVNGETVQDSPLSQMIFDVPNIIASLSSHLTLEPGDLILTGTPGGVGSRREPPLWLDARSTVEVEIPHVGTLTNTFTD